MAQAVNIFEHLAVSFAIVAALISVVATVSQYRTLRKQMRTAAKLAKLTIKMDGHTETFEISPEEAAKLREILAQQGRLP